MKKIITILIAFVYFFISSGFVVNVHYCMGKAKSFSVELTSQKNCGCGVKTKKSCCKTETKLVKLSTDHEKVQQHFSFNTLPQILPTTYNFIVEPLINVENKIVLRANAPPPNWLQQHIYIGNCLFLI